MLALMTKRNILSVEVDAAARAAIDEIHKDNGMAKNEIASRLIRWFAEQDDMVQKGVLRLLPKGIAGLAAVAVGVFLGAVASIGKWWYHE